MADTLTVFLCALNACAIVETCKEREFKRHDVNSKNITYKNGE